MNQPLAVVLFVMLLSIFPALPKGFTLGQGSFPGGKREAKRLRKTQDQLNTEVKETDNFFY